MVVGAEMVGRLMASKRVSETQPLLAARIHRLRDGQIVAVHCLLQYSQPSSVEAAVFKVRAGQTAFVACEDAARVLEAVRGTHG